ncbi:hypothetical protein J2772_000621 [Chryseobacterium jejuense]|nr:hypothetical protein [Chryseobacterium jejuense]
MILVDILIFDLIKSLGKYKKLFFPKSKKLKIIRYFIAKRQRFLEILILFLLKDILESPENFQESRS